MLGRKLRKIALTAALLTLAGALAAGGAVAKTTAGAHAGQDKVRIGYVLPDLANPFIAGLRDGALAEAKKRGWQVLVKGTNDAKGQTDAVLAYVAAKVDLIGMDPIDGNAMGPAVKAANKAGIPVIAIQSKPFSGKLATFIFPNETTAGTYMGNAAVAWCKNKNPCQVGIVEGNHADQSGVEENAAFRKTVGKQPNIKIVGAQPTNYDPVKALNVATNLLTANPDLDYLYAWWDQGGLAAVEAVRSKGRIGEVGISAQNGDCLALAAVIKGEMYQDSAFFPSIQGGYLITNAEKVLAGKSLPAKIEAPILSVTTPLARAWLAGKAKPPAALRADIMKRLRQAKAGKCPK